MEKQISLQEKEVVYCLKKSWRTKRLRLSIHGDGRFVVTAPAGLKKSFIEKYIQEKAEWVLEKIDLMKKQNEKNTFWKRDRREYLALKTQARRLVEKKARQYAQEFGFSYNKISIRNQNTRWGSCSQKGNLNYNYKIALLPEELADYIIVHELCHLKEFNHGLNFWRLVELILPDYKERIRAIKKIAKS